MTNLDVRGTLVEGDDVGLGGVEVGEQLLVLLLLRHAVPAVTLLARRLLLLPSSLHLEKYFCKLEKRRPNGRFFLGPAGSCLGFAQLLSFLIGGMAA